MAVTTPPVTQKRKASDSIKEPATSKRVRTEIAGDESQDLSRTPISETGEPSVVDMDSDEDMMSAGSGDELDFEEGTQASDLGSGD